jgi:hypothetical protein
MAKRSKYNATRTTVDGITFTSKREAKRYSELKLLEIAGEIKELVLQPRYELKVNGHVVTTYVADFRYDDCKTRKNIVEDTKGFRTPEYRIKKKLMLAIYKIEVLET